MQTLRTSSQAAFWLLFLGFCLLLIVASMSLNVNAFDEGFMIYGAERFAHGELPYRDFWFLYGPGEFVALAAFFKIFGTTILAGRLFFVAVMACLMAVMACLALLLGVRRRWIFLVAAGSILWVAGVTPSLLYPVFPALLLSFLTLLLMAMRWSRGERLWVVAAGVSFGLLLLVRHDVAFWAVLALVPGEIYANGRSADAADAAPLRGWRRSGSDMLLFLCGLLPVLAVAWFSLFRHTPLAAVYDQLFHYQTHVYKAVRGLPLPSLRHLPATDPSPFVTRHHLERGNQWRVFVNFLSVYLAWLVVAASLPCLASRNWRRSFLPWQLAVLLCLVAITATLPLSGLVRPDPPHEILGLLAAFLLLSVVAARRAPGPVARWLVGAAVAAAVLTCGGPCLRGGWTTAAFAKSLVVTSKPLSPWKLCRPVPGMERARCFNVESDETAAVLFLEQHTRPGDHIFSSGTRTDRISTVDAALYFLAGRDTSGKWEEFEPGVGNTVPVQQELIRDFDRDHVRYIVQDTQFDRAVEPNLSSVSSGVVLLDNYIAANYRPVVFFGTKRILQRVTPFVGPAQTCRHGRGLQHAQNHRRYTQTADPPLREG